MLKKLARAPTTLFRVDKFMVPAAARDEFLDQVSRTGALLGTLDGCLQSHILEQESRSGDVNIITIVEWDRAESSERARHEVRAMQRRMGVDPQEMLLRLGIRADMASYSQLA
jgi:hypothetical protein